MLGINLKKNQRFPNLTVLFFLMLKQMSTVGITENVKGDNKKFEIWYNGREEVYIIQVRLMLSYDFFPTGVFSTKGVISGCTVFWSRLVW